MNTMALRIFDLKEMATPSIFEELLTTGDDLKVLPVTHKVDWYNAKKTLSNGKINPVACDVFTKEKLVYLFYGRASYYIAQGVSSRGDESYYPVCFIIDIDSVFMDNVFPFDSGAFANNFYEGFIHKDMDVNDFFLNPDINFIKNFIKYFYDSNDNYYRSNCADVVNSDDLSLEIKSYLNMLNNKGKVPFDSRGTAIEIISKSSVDLSNNIKAIILPFDFARTDDTIKRMKSDYNVKIITYPTFGDEPGSYNSDIRRLLYEYLVEEGLC